MKSFLAFLAVAVCAGAGWSVYQSSLAAVDAGETRAEEKELPAVRIEPVRRQVVEDRIELVGGLEPQSTVEIRAAVPGYVVKLPVDLGDYVEAGTVIAELDDAEAREVV
ncbi:MAG TPA: biotin/lipoyl-binding protein, partial [Planctomycetaceae bacterium]